jgi:nicotinamidase-related amidase
LADGDLEDDYRRAGFNRRLGIGERPALIVVDFAQAYLDPDSPLYAGVEIVREVAARLLGVARRASIPVFHSRVEYQPGGADGGVFYRKIAALKCFDKGSPLGAFADGMEPVAGETVITKQYASAFFNTRLADELRAADVDTLIICGLTTSGCVRATAVDAIQHGFIPVVVRDAVGDRDPAPHEANLFDLENKYAELMTSSEAGAVMSQGRGVGPADD